MSRSNSRLEIVNGVILRDFKGQFCSPTLELLYKRILDTFSNRNFMGELRERWHEIKKLQVQPAMAKI